MHEQVLPAPQILHPLVNATLTFCLQTNMGRPLCPFVSKVHIALLSAAEVAPKCHKCLPHVRPLNVFMQV